LIVLALPLAVSSGAALAGDAAAGKAKAEIPAWTAMLARISRA
jgi:hypothetical protein